MEPATLFLPVILGLVGNEKQQICTLGGGLGKGVMGSSRPGHVHHHSTVRGTRWQTTKSKTEEGWRTAP